MRHSNGWYTGAYGRIGAGPIHISQSSVFGTGAGTGTVRSARDLPLRVEKRITRRTGPITPERSTSTAVRSHAPAEICVPSCVTTPLSAARRRSCALSSMYLHSGFWQ